MRTFGRVIPSDRAQAAAGAGWATDLGADRVATQTDGTAFGDAMVSGFEDALGPGSLVRARAGLIYYGGVPDRQPAALARGGGRLMVSDAELAPGAFEAPGTLATSAALDPAQLPPAGRRFARRFADEYDRPPGRYGAYGYEAMAVILDSIDRASEPTDRAAVIDAFFATTERDSVLGTYSIDSLGETTLDRMSGYRFSPRARPVARLCGARIDPMSTCGRDVAALVGTIVALLAIPQLAVAETRPSSSSGVVEDSYIVAYRDGVARPAAATASRERRLGFEADYTYSSALRGFAARLTPDQLELVRDDRDVAFVAANRWAAASAAVPLASGEPLPPTGVRRIRAATRTTVREASSSNVAMIDTGIRLKHPDLNAAPGIDCIDPGTPPSDGHGHGTHVAGTVGALNNGSGVVGVAPGTKDLRRARARRLRLRELRRDHLRDRLGDRQRTARGTSTSPT